MNNPSIDVLLKKVHCKYTLSVFAAKRARDIMDGETVLAESSSHKPVTLALEEIAQGKIAYRRIKDGIK
jgi:DNA-directed RNA polymerase subunit omega